MVQTRVSPLEFQSLNMTEEMLNRRKSSKQPMTKPMSSKARLKFSFEHAQITRACRHRHKSKYVYFCLSSHAKIK